MNEWFAITILAMVFALATSIRVRLGPVASASLGTREAELAALPHREPRYEVDLWKNTDHGLITNFCERADEGLITIADLERCLPAELPFHGRALTRRNIQRWWIVDRVQQYLVFYRCDRFFDCKPHFPFEANGHLAGMMRVDRVPPAQLPDILREQLRSLYWSLELEVEEESAQGCSILPPAPDRAA